MELFNLITADVAFYFFPSQAEEFGLSWFRSVTPLWRNMFAGKTCTLPLRACVFCSDSVPRGENILLASLICLIPFSSLVPSFPSQCGRAMPSISLQTESGPAPAAGRAPFCVPLCVCQTKPVPFTIEPENSHQCSGFVRVQKKATRRARVLQLRH